MPSPAPASPFYLRSLVLLQNYQLQQLQQLPQQQQQQQQQQQHSQEELSEQQLQQQLLFSAQKLKLLQQQQHFQQQQHHQPWLSSSILPKTLTASASASAPSSPQSLPLLGSPQYESELPISDTHPLANTALTLASTSPSSSTSPFLSSADYYKRRTSTSFISSFSTSPLPSFEHFGFGPEDFLSHPGRDSDFDDHQSDDRDHRPGASSMHSRPSSRSESKRPALIDDCDYDLEQSYDSDEGESEDALARLDSAYGHSRSSILLTSALAMTRSDDADDVYNIGEEHASGQGQKKHRRGAPATNPGRSLRAVARAGPRREIPGRGQQLIDSGSRQPAHMESDRRPSDTSISHNSSSRVQSNSDNSASSINIIDGSMKKRGHGLMAHRHAGDGDSALDDTLQLDLQSPLSLSSLSLASPRSTTAPAMTMAMTMGAPGIDPRKTAGVHEGVAESETEAAVDKLTPSGITDTPDLSSDSSSGSGGQKSITSATPANQIALSARQIQRSAPSIPLLSSSSSSSAPFPATPPHSHSRPLLWSSSSSSSSAAPSHTQMPSATPTSTPTAHAASTPGATSLAVVSPRSLTFESTFDLPSSSSTSPSSSSSSSSSLCLPSFLSSTTLTTMRITAPHSSADIASPSSTTSALPSSATHLQLLLQQHHALQRKEQEDSERLERAQQQQTQGSTTATTPTSPSATPTGNLRADAQSVAAYMAAYMKLATAGARADRTRNSESEAALTIDPAATSLSPLTGPTSPATIAPSSTMLYPSPPSPTLPLFSTTLREGLNASGTASHQKAGSKPTAKSHKKKASLSSSSSPSVASNSTSDLASVNGSNDTRAASTHRQECHNCGVTKTPLWRRTADRLHSLCNACGLYYKQYQSNRPLVDRPSSSSSLKDSVSTSSPGTDSAAVQAQLVDQQPKRRKISDADGGAISVKSEPMEGSQQKQQNHLKPLLPHPPTREDRRPLLPQQSQSLARIQDAEADSDQNEADDEVEDGEDHEMDEDMREMSSSNSADCDIEMAEVRTEREVSEENESSSESDSEYDEQSNQRKSDTEQTKAKDSANMTSGNNGGGATGVRNGKNSSLVVVECANCGQTQTPLWRKDAKGQSICNACGLYARLHQRSRPITMRKSKITRRKREWNAVQDKETNNNMDISNTVEAAKGPGQGHKGISKKRKEKALGSEGHIEVRAMNIPVSSGHESDESTSFCFMGEAIEDRTHLPTPASNASLSPIMSAPVSTAMALGSGSLSPALTASPPTPVLTPPHFLSAAASASLVGLNPLFLQQYQQQLQNQMAFNAASTATTSTTEGLSMLNNTNWLSQLYPQYPTASFLNGQSLSQDPIALTGFRQQQQQQQQQRPQNQSLGPFQTKAASPVSPVSLSSTSSFSAAKPNPIITDAQSLQDLARQQQQQQQQIKQVQLFQPANSGGQKKAGGPLILDSTRFTRLMNQMSKPQLSMFLTILEERCGALRHRLSGDDDQVGRVDTNEMMMMLNTPQFTSMESGLTGHSNGGMGGGHGSLGTTGSNRGMTASAAVLAAMNELNGGHDHHDRSDFMM